MIFCFQLLMEMDEDIVLDEIPDPNEMEDIRLEILSVEDWVTIKNIQSSFVSIFQEENIQSVCDDISDRASALISWSQYANQITLRFISFVRQIDEFEGLHADDRFILIKYNLLSLFPIYKCFYYKKINGCESYEDNEEAENRCCYFAQWDESKDICEIFTNLIRSLAEITEQDSTLLSLLLVILIFSQGLSMNENEPLLKDSLAVNRAQSYYKKLLWNYSINKWDEEQACKCFAQLFTIILQLQSAIKRFRDFIRVQCMISNAVDRITPLMQTLLDIY